MFDYRRNDSRVGGGGSDYGCCIGRNVGSVGGGGCIVDGGSSSVGGGSSSGAGSEGRSSFLSSGGVGGGSGSRDRGSGRGDFDCAVWIFGGEPRDCAGAKGRQNDNSDVVSTLQKRQGPQCDAGCER